MAEQRAVSNLFASHAATVSLLLYFRVSCGPLSILLSLLLGPHDLRLRPSSCRRPGVGLLRGVARGFLPPRENSPLGRPLFPLVSRFDYLLDLLPPHSIPDELHVSEGCGLPGHGAGPQG